MASRRSWEPYRSLITEKYLVEKWSIKDIMKYMQEEKDFSARYACHHFTHQTLLTAGSKSEYERQLKAWRCRKNATQDIWKFISQKLKEREAQGKQSDVYVYGNMVDRAVVRRHTDRVVFTFIESRMICE